MILQNLYFISKNEIMISLENVFMTCQQTQAVKFLSALETCETQIVIN